MGSPAIVVKLDGALLQISVVINWNHKGSYQTLINELGLSQGNLTYYAPIIRHQSLYKIRRFRELQGILYIVCYLFFRN